MGIPELSVKYFHTRTPFFHSYRQEVSKQFSVTFLHFLDDITQSKTVSTLKGKNLLLEEQILPV